MSVLKKIGVVFTTILGDVTQFLGFPFIAALLGHGKVGAIVQTVLGDLNTLVGFLTMAEIMYPSIAGSKTGSQKLAAAAPLVEKEMLLWAQSNLPGHSKVKVPAEKFSADCKAFTSALADIVNDFGE